MKDFYCSQKFWWLTVDPERKEVSSCCAASPVKVDIGWINSHPGQLFNIPEFQNDRLDMLDGKPVVSCESCWFAEGKGITSRRMMGGSDSRTHSDIISSPEAVHLILGIDCNMTCSYCCKQYSTAWMRDVNDNGPYIDKEPRYIITAQDQLILKMGQRKVKQSNVYQTFLNEIVKYKDVKEFQISGGEPFLYNGLETLVNKIDAPVIITTGLGVTHTRFNRVLDLLPSSVSFRVSAENIGKLYEFNRYGNTYDNFRLNLDVLAKKFDFKFNSILSNLTIHGYQDFLNEYSSIESDAYFCSEPEYQNIHILDGISKQNVNRIKYNKLDREIKDAVNKTPSDELVTKFKSFTREFANRRNLDLSIFPDNFTEWILRD